VWVIRCIDRLDIDGSAYMATIHLQGDDWTLSNSLDKLPKSKLIRGIHTTDYTLAASLGFTMARFWDFHGTVLRADRVETDRNVWHHEPAIAELNACLNAGLAPLGVLFTKHEWRAPYIGANLENPNEKWDGESLTTLNPWQWLCAVMTYVYKSQVRFWEVWNEPYSEHFWPNPNPVQYVEAVRQAAEFIRKRRGLVVGGSLDLFGPFAHQALKAGLAEHCDILSVHYPFNGRPGTDRVLFESAMKSLRRFNKPIWITETGSATHLDPKPQVIRDFMRIIEDAGVDATFHYYLDTRGGGYTNSENIAEPNGGVKFYAHAVAGL
jgi:hypothetical protein